MTNYGDQFMKCPECGGVAEAECVDVGVGLYIKDEYECPCGYNSAADGRINVGSYDDWFPDDRPIVAEQQGGGVMATKTKVKPLDLSVLLRDAFLAGRGLKDGDRLSKEDQAAWMAYDPERMAAYDRIVRALYPGLTH